METTLIIYYLNNKLITSRYSHKDYLHKSVNGADVYQIPVITIG